MADYDMPFEIMVYDKDFGRVGPIGNPLSVSVTPRHNQQPTASLILPANHRRMPDLMQPGARLWIRYRGDHLMSGYVRLRQVDGPLTTAICTFQLIDDWFLFNRLLAWPVPANAIGLQDAEQDVRSGPAETVLKGYLTANKGRSVPSVSVSTDAGRGSTISLSQRFKPFTDAIIPAVDSADLGTTVMQSGTGLLMDVYPIRVYSRTLSEDSGTIVTWNLSSADMEATQMVVGGKGEGVDRLLVRRLATDLEAEYGYSIEAFKDDTSVDTSAALNASGDVSLAERRPSNGISITLSETSIFRYDPTGLNGVRVGDVVTVQVAPSLTRTDILRQCTITWSGESGLTVTPQLGEQKNDTSLSLKKTVASLARAVRNLSGR